MAVTYTDDMGRKLIVAREPRRIVSLVPSDTYSVVALGAGDRLVGRTDYCVEPSSIEVVPSVGGTKDVDPDKVAELEPDLILANQEENARPPLEELARRGLRVFVSFPRRVAEGFAHLARLARILGLADSGEVKELIKIAYGLLHSDAEVDRRRSDMPSAFVPVWNDPLMTFNEDTFASDLLVQAGFRNCFADRQRQYPLAADLGRRSPLSADRLADRDRRYPRISDDELVARAPDVVLLPDEPHPFGPADVKRFCALDIPAARDGAVHLVSGKDLFWYGARAAEGLQRLRQLAAEHGT